jgi:hypothetical protein
VGVSLAGQGEPPSAAAAGKDVGDSSGDQLEGAGAAVQAVSAAERAWPARQSSRGGYCPRDGRVRAGDRAHGAPPRPGDGTWRENRGQRRRRWSLVPATGCPCFVALSRRPVPAGGRFASPRLHRSPDVVAAHEPLLPPRMRTARHAANAQAERPASRRAAPACC